MLLWLLLVLLMHALLLSLESVKHITTSAVVIHAVCVGACGVAVMSAVVVVVVVVVIVVVVVV